MLLLMLVLTGLEDTIPSGDRLLTQMHQRSELLKRAIYATTTRTILQECIPALTLENTIEIRGLITNHDDKRRMNVTWWINKNGKMVLDVTFDYFCDGKTLTILQSDTDGKLKSLTHYKQLTPKAQAVMRSDLSVFITYRYDTVDGSVNSKFNGSMGRISNSQESGFTVLQHADAFGKYTLRHTKDHFPVFISVEQAAHHIGFKGAAISESAEKNGQGLKYSNSFSEVTESAIFNGTRFPVKIKTIQDYMTTEGVRNKYVYTQTLSDLKFIDSPPEMFVVEPGAIPNGTNVTVDGEEHIDHEWHDGQVVKRINRDTVVGLVQHEFQRGSLSYVIIGIIAVCLSIYIWFILWQRRQIKENTK
jgi:hypothetical protein